jgi:hypothetical protein
MTKFIREIFGLYYLLYFLSFLSIYFYPDIVPILNGLILITSYYLIIRRHRFDVVISLILYSRCLNGFILFHNPTVFVIVNLLTNVVPLALYFFMTLSQKSSTINLKVLDNYKFTLLFFVLLTLSFVFNFSTSYDLITKRYLPFVFFVLFLLAFTKPGDFNSGAMLGFFRSIFLSSLIVFFFSDYLSVTRELMESDQVFNVASDSNTFSLIYFSFTRNMGPTWDHRILAIIGYLYLLLAITNKSKYLTWDILLSLVVVVMSLSRGAILTYSFILVAYFFQIGKQRLIITFMSIAILIGVLLVLSKGLLPESTLDYLESFTPGSKDNALDQRSVFAKYALNAFAESPIFGKGVGNLTSRLIDRSIEVDGASVPVAGDAFWYILSAEMGLAGVLLYLLFLKEVFLSKNILFVALFFGVCIQLLGTDIPDMRFYYFAILVLVFMAKKNSQHASN